MNVPLKWLSDYVKLPKDLKVVTDKLTSVGHMLDKTFERGRETVIDLELRGNRVDMFGLIGVAREVGAVTNSRLKLPPTVPLPKLDKSSSLINVQPSTKDLVFRYTAVKLAVKVGPSPEWLVNRLTAYGIPSVNNVVDITNYVMVETSHPMHAFDYAKIKGGQLILRRAKPGEKFSTIQQGTTLILTGDDLAIADQAGVQCLNIIGGLSSRVTDETTSIILESAVYNSANCRRTARRLKTITEGGLRHEKHQDPNGVALAMQRGIYLLQELAEGKVEGLTSDYYPNPVKTKVVDFDIAEVKRLTGVNIPLKTVGNILDLLEFKNKRISPRVLNVTIPTFRTDIEGSADIVEEVIRIYGYDQIPTLAIADATPVPDTYPSFIITEKLRDVGTHLGLDEVITLTMVDKGEVKLVNPPDPDLSYLRADIYPSLVKYAQRLLNLRQSQVSLFEAGKTFTQKGDKYEEHLRLGVAIAGKEISISHLAGMLQKVTLLLGVQELPVRVGVENNIYWAEIDVDKLMADLPPFSNPYSLVSTFPPLIEDMNFTYTGNYDEMVNKIKKVSDLITQVDLVDKYDDKLTLRITYHSNEKQLSSQDITPIRQKLQPFSV